MDRLLVENEAGTEYIELDMYPNNSLSLNIRVNTVGDLGSRNSSYSNTFTIPKTPKNVEAFRYAGLTGNTSKRPYRVIKCRYLIDTFTVFNNGYIQLLESNGSEYRVAVFDGILDLGVILNEKKINEMDFSQYDHYLDINGFVDSFQNTEGYIYALADFGKDMLQTSVEVEKVAPSIFVKTIWDKIFTENGLTYSGDFFNSNSDWPWLVIPPTKGIDLQEVEQTTTSIGTSTSAANSDSGQFTTYQGYIDSEYDFQTDGYNSLATVSLGRIVMNYTGLIKLKMSTTYTSDGTTDLRNRVELNGGGKGTFNVSPNANPVQHELVLNVTSGDIIQVKAQAARVFDDWPPSDFDYDYTSTLAIEIETVTGGVLVNVDDYVSSNLTQLDFVKDVLQRFGLVMTRDAVDPQNYIFTQLEVILNDRANAQDWTNKLVAFGKEKYRSNYAQFNEMKYKYPADTVPQYDGTMSVDDQNLPYSKTLWTSIYQIPNLSTKKVGNIQLYDLPIWRILDDGEIENSETETSMMRLIFSENNLPYRIFGSGSTNVNTPVPFLRLNNMFYWVLINQYYTAFNNLLNDYVEQDVELNMDIVDYNRLDLTKLVYFKQTGSYYYIDSIRISQKRASAKLLKISNFNL